MIIVIDVFVWSFGISILSSICRCGRRVGWWTTRHPCADRILTNSGNPIKWKCILSMFIIKQYRQRCVVAFFAATINSNPKQMRIHYKNIYIYIYNLWLMCQRVYARPEYKESRTVAAGHVVSHCLNWKWVLFVAYLHSSFLPTANDRNKTNMWRWFSCSFLSFSAAASTQQKICALPRTQQQQQQQQAIERMWTKIVKINTSDRCDEQVLFVEQKNRRHAMFLWYPHPH